MQRFRSIKFKFMYLITALLLIVTGFVIFKDISSMKELLYNENKLLIERFDVNLKKDMEEKVDILGLSMDMLLHNPEIIKTFANRQREPLANLTVKYYNEILHAKYGIKYFHFHLPPAISFLRVNNPNKYGDDLSQSRNMVVNANKDRVAQKGIEVGKSGLGLRVIEPVFYEGVHIGSIELGIELEDVLKIIKQETGSEYALGIFSDIYQTFNKNTQDSIINKGTVFFDFSETHVKGIMNKFFETDRGSLVKIDDKYFIGSFFDIKDYSDKVIGKILVIKNVTYGVNVMRNNIILKIVLYIAGVLAIIIAIFVVTNRLIIRPLGVAINYTQMIGDGNLDIVIESDRNDEIGFLFTSLNNMIIQMTSVIKKAKTVADAVAHSSHNLNLASSDMYGGIGNQADKASQIATAATQMEQTTKEIAKNTSSIASFAANTLNLAREGESIVKKSVQEVKSIETSVSALSSMITVLGEKSKQIGAIVNSIYEIADQTNLLALNAAIESARAGELGRGFAVVADEVRKLAEKTTKATADIGVMIQSIQSETSKAVTSMDDSLEKVSAGVTLTANAGKSLTKIVSSVTELQVRVEEVASSTEEMINVTTQVGNDIDIIASISTDNKEHADHLAKSSKTLEELSLELMDVINRFQVNDTLYIPK